MESRRFRNTYFWIHEDGTLWNANKNQWCKLSSDRNGYKVWTLRIQGKTKQFRVHRLVAEMFLPNPTNLPMVLHADDNPKNNHVTNLRWGSAKDNMQDKIIRGRAKTSYRGGNIYWLENKQIYHAIITKNKIRRQTSSKSYGHCLMWLKQMQLDITTKRQRKRGLK
jgi:HNH endonuclease